MSFPTPFRLLVKVLANDVLVANVAKGYIAAIQDVSNLAKRIDSDETSDDMPNAVILEMAVRQFFSYLEKQGFSFDELFEECFPLLVNQGKIVENDKLVASILEKIEAEVGYEAHLNSLKGYEYAEV